MSPRVGLQYRRAYRAALFLNRPRVDALELVAEHFLDLSARQRDELDLLRAHFSLTVHALGTSVGTADGVDERYLDKLARLIAYVRPRWWSDHLAFTRVGRTELGAFAPLPRTAEAIEVVARNVARVRAVIKAPFALENPAAPFALDGAQMDPGAFLRAVSEAADCALVLDLENLHADGWNVGTDPDAVLAAIPLERVLEIHLAGGRPVRGRYLDAHDSPVPAATWRFYRAFCRRGTPPLTIVEREAALPPLEVVLAELDTARAIAAAPGPTR